MTTFLLFAKTLLALGAVLGAVFLLARIARRAQRVRPHRRAVTASAAPLELRARKGLARGASIVLVRAGERFFVVGATAQSVQLIAEVPRDEIVDDTPTAVPESPWTARSGTSNPAWDATLSKLRELTVRR